MSIEFPSATRIRQHYTVARLLPHLHSRVRNWNLTRVYLGTILRKKESQVSSWYALLSNSDKIELNFSLYQHKVYSALTGSRFKLATAPSEQSGLQELRLC